MWGPKHYLELEKRIGRKELGCAGLDCECLQIIWRLNPTGPILTYLDLTRLDFCGPFCTTTPSCIVEGVSSELSGNFYTQSFCQPRKVLILGQKTRTQVMALKLLHGRWNFNFMGGKMFTGFSFVRDKMALARGGGPVARHATFSATGMHCSLCSVFCPLSMKGRVCFLLLRPTPEEWWQRVFKGRW